MSESKALPTEAAGVETLKIPPASAQNVELLHTFRICKSYDEDEPDSDPDEDSAPAAFKTKAIAVRLRRTLYHPRCIKSSLGHHFLLSMELPALQDPKVANELARALEVKAGEIAWERPYSYGDYAIFLASTKIFSRSFVTAALLPAPIDSSEQKAEDAETVAHARQQREDVGRALISCVRKYHERGMHLGSFGLSSFAFSPDHPPQVAFLGSIFAGDYPLLANLRERAICRYSALVGFVSKQELCQRCSDLSPTAIDVLRVALLLLASDLQADKPQPSDVRTIYFDWMDCKPLPSTSVARLLERFESSELTLSDLTVDAFTHPLFE